MAAGIAPEASTGARREQVGDRAILNCPGLLLSSEVVHPLVVEPVKPPVFSKIPPMEPSGGLQTGATSAPFVSLFPDSLDHPSAADTAAVSEERIRVRWHEDP